jgi:DNA-directed RNA polymerase specialized sigma24 family protein
MSNTNKAIELLAKHHSEFIDMTKAIAGNNFEVRNYAEDYVQDAYIRLMRYDDLYDKIIVDDKASKGYMFFTVRSIVINDMKRVKTCRYNFIGDEYDMEEKFMLEDKGLDPQKVSEELIETKMYEVLKDNTDWFDYELFRTYLKTGKSFRVLAEESGLGIQTIYLSIKKSKLIIAQELYEDYLDFKNGEL